jgi:hypothetical protein
MLPRTTSQACEPPSRPSVYALTGKVFDPARRYWLVTRTISARRVYAIGKQNVSHQPPYLLSNTKHYRTLQDFTALSVLEAHEPSLVSSAHVVYCGVILTMTDHPVQQ